MIRTLAIAGVLAFVTYCHADEPAGNQAGAKLDASKLLSRIDQLEGRIAALEERQRPPGHAGPQATQPPNPGSYYSNAPPLQPNPGPNQHQILPPAFGTPLQPIAPSPDNAPRTWQRFNFNGQWFYIVPVEQAQTIREGQLHAIPTPHVQKSDQDRG